MLNLTFEPWMMEAVGTVASVLIALSLTLKNIVRLRVLNTLGALVFTLYGLAIGSVPVTALNAFIVAVNLWYLLRFWTSAEAFNLVNVSLDDPQTRHFLDFWAADMARSQPDFQRPAPGAGPEASPGLKAAFVLRQTLPVSLLIWTRNAAGEQEILLDYAVPAYRDRKCARWLFTQGWKHLDLEGAAELTAFARVPAHQRYLESLGFHKVETVGGLKKYKIRLGSPAPKTPAPQ